MKNATITDIALLFILAIAFTACNKYEEGANYSLATKKARVENEWKLRKATAESDGFSTDITSSQTLSTKKEGTYIETTSFGSVNISENGTWAFSENKTLIIMTEADGDIFTGKIKKLKKDEMTLVEVDGNTTYTYEYVTK